MAGPHFFTGSHEALLFRDRLDAGKQLAARLEHYRGSRALVLGIPRGGVPVAAAVARELGADLDIIVARKIGAPEQRELALGAVTADGACTFNEGLIRELGVSRSILARQVAAVTAEAQERERRLRDGRRATPVAGRTAILVDDGLATGATMRAAIRSLRTRRAAQIVAAVPVGSHEACSAIASEADELICLYQPSDFYAVGQFYRDFRPTEDEEVLRILRADHPVATASQQP